MAMKIFLLVLLALAAVCYAGNVLHAYKALYVDPIKENEARKSLAKHRTTHLGEPTDTDIIVIGTGFAGTQCARTLFDAGSAKVEVYEANDYIGGRVDSRTWTSPEGVNLTYDVGAEYAGRAQPGLWNYIYKDYSDGIIDTFGQTINYPYSTAVVGGHNNVHRWNRNNPIWGIGGIPNDLNQLDMVSMLALLGEISAFQPTINIREPWRTPYAKQWDLMSVEEWLSSKNYLTPFSHDLIALSVKALLSVEADEVSTLYYFWYCVANDGFINEVNDEADGPQQYILRQSFHTLLQNILKPVTDAGLVHTNKAVAHIDHSKADFVTVTFKDGGKRTAKRVIVAASPGTVAKHIKFTPELSKARQVINNQPMGRTIKMFFFYREPWWRTSNKSQPYSGYSGNSDSAEVPGKSDPLTVMWVMDNTQEFPGNPYYTLMTFVVGHEIDRLGEKAYDEQFIAEKVTDQLGVIFESMSGAKNYTDYLYGIWDKSSFIGGGPNTVMGKGVLTSAGPALRQASEGPHDTVFFTAAEYALFNTGYMNGGINAGANTANRVLQSLGKPQTVLPRGVSDESLPLEDQQQYLKLEVEQINEEFKKDPRYQYTNTAVAVEREPTAALETEPTATTTAANEGLFSILADGVSHMSSGMRSMFSRTRTAGKIPVGSVWSDFKNFLNKDTAFKDELAKFALQRKQQRKQQQQQQLTDAAAPHQHKHSSASSSSATHDDMLLSDKDLRDALSDLIAEMKARNVAA